MIYCYTCRKQFAEVRAPAVGKENVMTAPNEAKKPPLLSSSSLIPPPGFAL
jgi:hypothetical protein